MREGLAGASISRDGARDAPADLAERLRGALRDEACVEGAYCLLPNGRAGNGCRPQVAVLLAAGLRPLEHAERLLSLADRLAVAAGTALDVADMERMGPVLASRLEREGLLIVDRNPGRRWWVEAMARRGRPDGAARRPVSSLAVRERLRSGRVFGRRGLRD